MAADDPSCSACVRGRRSHTRDCEGAALESELGERLDADYAFSRRVCVARAGTTVASVRLVIPAGTVATFASYFRRLLRMVSARATIDIANPANVMIVINVVISITSHI